MLRVNTVRSLCFGWAKTWRRGSEPPALEKLFDLMVMGHDFLTLCAKVFDVFKRTPKSYEELDARCIAAVVSSLFVLHPSAENGDDHRTIVVDKIRQSNKWLLATLTPKDCEYVRQLHEGVALGLVLAVVELDNLHDPCETLETDLWSLALTAAGKAVPYYESAREKFGAAGELSELMSRYVRAGESTRRESMEQAIVSSVPVLTKELSDIGVSLNDRRGSMAGCLVNELLYKVIGSLSIDDRIMMVTKHSRKRK